MLRVLHVNRPHHLPLVASWVRCLYIEESWAARSAAATAVLRGGGAGGIPSQALGTAKARAHLAFVLSRRPSGARSERRRRPREGWDLPRPLLLSLWTLSPAGPCAPGGASGLERQRGPQPGCCSWVQREQARRHLCGPSAPPAHLHQGCAETPGQPSRGRGASGTMKLPTLPPVPGTVLGPASLVCVCPVLLPGGYSVCKPDTGGKKTGFLHSLGLCCSHSSPGGRPLLPGVSRDLQGGPRALPSLGTGVGSSLWQVPLPGPPAAHEMGPAASPK